VPLEVSLQCVKEGLLHWLGFLHTLPGLLEDRPAFDLNSEIDPDQKRRPVCLAHEREDEASLALQFSFMRK